MSRSYKKHHISKDSNSRKTPHRLKGKTLAVRAVRRSEDIPGGKSGYKRLYERYNICDHRFMGFEDENHLKRVCRHDREGLGRCYPSLSRRGEKATLRLLIRRWKKRFVNK